MGDTIWIDWRSITAVSPIADKADMLQPTSTSAESGTKLLGELHPLTDRLGSTEGLATLTALSARFPRVQSLSTLRKFLQNYIRDILVPIELPAIYQSFLHASRNEVRELIAFDQRIGIKSKVQD